MNIQEAKQEIIHTITAYTAKNQWGGYAIPALRQRPLLLIGPPGIGKTAVMEQAASACGVGFVSYTMTHHTRQSAIGLPFIEHRTFGGREYAVTEYTMSEIVASVFNRIEETGCREGLLFLDEINCVSETLAPAMLQFLQNKTFGSHRLPEGWVLAAAGNPQEYNKSVREFDIATLDRLKYIQLEADYQAWRSYALESGIHGAILSYLDTRPDQFYVLEQSYADKTFVTARGWEDLSCLLIQYEALNLPVTPDLVGQYLHCERLARDFSGYYRWFKAREGALPLLSMMEGDPKALASCQEAAKSFSPAERLQLAHLALSSLGGRLREWEEEKSRLGLLLELLERLGRYQKQQDIPSPTDALPGFLDKEQEVLAVRREHGLSSEQELRRTQQSLYELRALGYEYLAEGKPAGFFSYIEENRREEHQEKARSLSVALDCSIAFFSSLDGPEFTVFLSSLNQNPLALSFLRQNPCPRWEQHQERLQFAKREEALRLELEKNGNGS